jgi:hypothetical protein
VGYVQARYVAPAGWFDDAANTVRGVVDRAMPVLDVAKNVIQDPALPEVTSLMLKLHALEQKSTKPGAPAPAPVKGIGLSRAVKPLRMYVAVRQEPILGYALVAGILAIPFLAGFGVGRHTGRRK